MSLSVCGSSRACWARPCPSAAQRAPTPEPINLPPDVLSLACAPTLTFEEPPTPLRVTGSQNSSIHKNFAPGDLITINAGTDNGIEVGQLYYTRRLVPRERQRSIGRDNPATIQTTGWLRIYAVDKQMSLATISYPCDAIHLYDYLEPFVLPTLPTVSTDRVSAAARQLRTRDGGQRQSPELRARATTSSSIAAAIMA